MVFVFNRWERFCSELQKRNIMSISASEVSKENDSFLVLKHDVESNPIKAFKLAQIENKFGHHGSYYVQAYLLDDEKNVDLLKKMQKMGHEISYHYDVMDSNNGDIESAYAEFEANRKRFESFGFTIKTVCQHGNPVVIRDGYTSNRDFFRSTYVQEKYPNIADIMVDYKDKYNTDYTYFSDAGYGFKLIFDPINNDVIPSDDKNIKYDNLDEVLKVLPNKAIISTHPHRWGNSVVRCIIIKYVFKIIKIVAKIIRKIPIINRLMSKYYYLAKKI